jgi:hypothetical protein
MDEVLRWLGAVVAIGGPSVAIAYAVFTWAGKRWIEQRLIIQLEKFKSEQQKELERLRHLLSSRVSRIHEKEFEVLPKAWFMLHDTHGSAARALGAVVIYYPDFARFTEAQFAEFLTVSRLSTFQREALRSSSDRNKYFMEAMAGFELDDAREKQRTFHNYLIEHRIFMTDDLRSKFSAVDDELSRALSEHEAGRRGQNWELEHSAIERVTHLKERIDDVEEAVQKRLHYEEA